ncbi:hypothetical protein BHE74_00058310 [Ensete ventricosum]|uniref:Uncharacterized protein n=1 Tax=Ensete ventricosum TaxID=4639 RepID=A0A426XTM8_ENSVE|nr:hypothetical protein B296_00055615 [Ensete ventricosum]RWW10138.1 hypothetical protein GW17_00026334 [Ensete ventricosum]RWW36652.1 hypothetical protein BHE74_00058310 [Ensete ventricosum]
MAAAAQEQRHQKMAEDQDEAEDMQHGPFPIEHLQLREPQGSTPLNLLLPPCEQVLLCIFSPAIISEYTGSRFLDVYLLYFVGVD